MDLAALGTYAMTIAVLALKPGPGVLAVVTKTAGRGAARFLSYMSGATLGEVVYLALVVFGAVVFAEELLFVSIFLKALAGAYLIYLGVGTLTKPLALDVDFQKTASLKDNWEDFTTGLMLTLSNPFVIIVFGGIVPSVIGTQDVSFANFGILALVTVVVQISIDFMYCVPVFVSRRFFRGKTLEGLRLASGMAMILIGLYLGYSALPAEDLLSVF